MTETYFVYDMETEAGHSFANIEDAFEYVRVVLKDMKPIHKVYIERFLGGVKSE